MSKKEKLILKILSGESDNNIMFKELISLLKYLGFSERIKGSHHIMYKDGIPENITVQNKKSKAKEYQIKQIRNIFEKYKLGGDINE